MSILSSFARRFLRRGRPTRSRETLCATDKARISRFEQLEVRNPLTADVHLGSVYLEPASGNDGSPNLIQVTFQGGAPGTQLTHLVINGDKNKDGQYSSGEIFFDTAAGGLGVFASSPLHIVQSNGFTVTNSQVVDGGQQLIFDLQGFDAGEKLVFSIDVDEVQFVDPTDGSIDVNAVVEGNEFQRSIMTGTFVAPHFQTASGSALYWDAFDHNFADANASSGTTLSLPNDRYDPNIDQTDLSAGAVLTLKQIPLPITISGTVYYDKNLSNLLDAGEQGIGNVKLSLLQWDGQQYVDTGKTTTTDSLGNYKFDGILPGRYCVAETQPNGWFSVGSQPGTVESAVDGISMDADHLCNIDLLGGQDGIHYNFGEALPGSISGKVWADPQGDCMFGPTDIALAGVQIDLLDAAGHLITSTTTDAQGHYEFDNLAPGLTYGVFEHQPAGYYQGMANVGSIGGLNSAEDTLTQIFVGSDVHGINYDFCEELPASIAGRVWADPQGDCMFGPTDIKLARVTIDLLDSQGHVIRTTTTDSEGKYKFDNLAPGTYGVFEHQPAGYYQGMANVGSVGGVNSAEDTLTEITLGSSVDAVNYDFCEELPASIAGRVWADPEADCIYGPNDIPLSGVQIDLLDSGGHVVATTTTNDQGQYEFDNLAPGTYGVFEHQPAGYYQGMANVGSVGGVNSAEDMLTEITLGSDVHGVNYDFCEELPGSISGHVHADPEGDCIIGPNDIPLGGVQIDLLDPQGHVIRSTTTNDQGYYEFTGLAPGTYGVFEHQPAGYFDDGGDVGSLGGVVDDDTISQINVHSNEHGTDYDFCEHLPNSISGHVHADPEGDCIIGPNDIMLSGVQIDLLDEQGNVIATTTTNDQGYYEFTNLDRGTYSVFEHQPAGYLNDDAEAGSLGGVVDGDLISQIVLVSDDHGTDYDFCEHIPNSIQGSVHLDPEGDCEIGPHDIMLSGVQIDLLDAEGHVIATTTTNDQGVYIFDNLDGGTYTVHQHAPPQYFDDGGEVGSLGGTANGDYLSDIVLVSDDHGVNYDFCLHPPGSISGYVFQDGPTITLAPGQKAPTDLTTIRDGQRTPDDKPIAGVTLLLYDQSGNPILDSAGHQRTAVTNSQGFYEFTGLDADIYLVRELQPGGYIDSIDTPGTTGGIADNPNAPLSAFLPFDPKFDVIAEIPLAIGQNSQENNFSEVKIQPTPIFIPPTFVPPENPPPLANPAPPQIPHLVIPPFLPPPPIPDLGGGDALGFTWHLSIVDAGYPRGTTTQMVAMSPASAAMEGPQWNDLPITDAEWILLDSDGHEVHRHVMGIKNAIPVAGDFNGDGVDELGLYFDGQWFIDLNGNGQWDAADLWAKLGTREDKPVVGDWNGDGKADIGIFGPAWARDPKAIQADGGLPDPMNKFVAKRKKNIPPTEEEATSGQRKMQLGANGKVRAELIDHVFHYGTAVDTAIVGDWTGAGIRRIGTFHNGAWMLDTDGDGRLTENDLHCQFGQAGDIPVVGDWTGDGIEKIGVYRNGAWHLDTNNNHRLDPGDRVVQLGRPGDKPVVGNFNGDGRAEVGVYRATGASAAANTAKVPAASSVK